MESVFKAPVACTIGHFDGVHLGHQHVIRTLQELSRNKGIERNIVITFDRLPRTLFDPTFQPLMLTTIDERKRLLYDMGIDHVEVLKFDMLMASTPAYDFMRDILRDRFNVRMLLLGYDNRFGKRNPSEGLEEYKRYGMELGIEVIGCDKFEVEGIGVVSSSLIRQFVANGELDKVEKCGVKMRP